jgi:hypothetical protein
MALFLDDMESDPGCATHLGSISLHYSPVARLRRAYLPHPDSHLNLTCAAGWH